MSRTLVNRIFDAPAGRRRGADRPRRHTGRSSTLRRAGVAAVGAVLALGLVACEPPTTNSFPVPLPHNATASDSWHACRDGCARTHKGVDIFAAEQTPIVAVETGVIARVDNTDNGAGGLSLWLRGESDVTYYYAHNVVNLVSAGQHVTRGQVIARVGRTGNAKTTPPHIHFQVNTCGDLDSVEPCTVNPLPYLRAWPQR
jgi:murein DD-endopeptidase MepM/ murein hydrolase activator NlpD